MKTVPLTIRRCPEDVHRTLKKSARVHRRSLNAEVLTRLEQEAEAPMSGRELARRLRKARELLTEQEHRAFAADIERGLKLMRREHLH